MTINDDGDDGDKKKYDDYHDMYYKRKSLTKNRFAWGITTKYQITASIRAI